MANTTIIRHNAVITVRDDEVGGGTTRNLAASKATLQLFLLILLASTATAATTRHDDGNSTRDDGGERGHANGTGCCFDHSGKFENSGKLDSKTLNISQIDTTKIDIDLLNSVAARRNRTAKSIIDFQYKEIRNRWLTDIKLPPDWTKGIVYWMYRDQRVQDNWAVLYAQKLAIINRVPLHVVFCTANAASKITLRQFKYMIQGLKEVESEFRNLNIPFHLLYGGVVDVLPDFVRNHNIGGIVVDFLPLRDYTYQTRQLAKIFNHTVPVIMVDAHNIIPCWSHERSFVPPPIHRDGHCEYKKMLTEFPPVVEHPFNRSEPMPEPIRWEVTDKKFNIDHTVLPVTDIEAGYREGIFELESFMKYRLRGYARNLRNPMKNGLSNLSPWLHFGQISAQRVMLEINRFSIKYLVKAKGFKYEVYKRRERSDLFCYHNLEKYDNFNGTQKWAIDELNQHRNDTREHLYTREEFEKARTHDDLWNAAQLQMVIEGKMHRLLRMYWAKKILEWTDTPENALATAIYLNNKYSLDGNDPNSYNGCMWAICGLHDRPWRKGTVRPVFGKLRYLDHSWYLTRFDSVAFIKKYIHYKITKEKVFAS